MDTACTTYGETSMILDGSNKKRTIENIYERVQREYSHHHDEAASFAEKARVSGVKRDEVFSVMRAIIEKMNRLS